MTPILQGGTEHSPRPNWAALFVTPFAAALTPLDLVLASMVRAGQGLEALCLYLGLARNAVFERIVALGLSTPHDRPMRRPCGRRPWTVSDVHALIRTWVDGARVVCIAEQLGRSPGAVSSKARRLGMPKRDRSQLARLEPRTRRTGGAGTSAIAPASSAQPAGQPPPKGLSSDRLDDGIPVLPAARAITDGVPAVVVSPASLTLHAVEQDTVAVPLVERPTFRSTAPGINESQASASVNVRAESATAPAQPVPQASRYPLPQTDKVGASTEAAKEPPNRRQSRPGERVWTKELDLELSMRGWANQHPLAIERDMRKYGDISAIAVSSRLSRLQMPRRERALLVDTYDPALGERNAKASGYVLRFCEIKKRHFWSPRNGPRRFCKEALKSTRYHEMSAGLG